MSGIVLHYGITNTFHLLHPSGHLGEKIANNDYFSLSILPHPSLLQRRLLRGPGQDKYILENLKTICRGACLSNRNLVGGFEIPYSFAPEVIGCSVRLVLAQVIEYMAGLVELFG